MGRTTMTTGKEALRLQALVYKAEVAKTLAVDRAFALATVAARALKAAEEAELEAVHAHEALRLASAQAETAAQPYEEYTTCAYTTASTASAASAATSAQTNLKMTKKVAWQQRMVALYDHDGTPASIFRSFRRTNKGCVHFTRIHVYSYACRRGR
jgi:hypothetical protein